MPKDDRESWTDVTMYVCKKRTWIIALLIGAIVFMLTVDFSCGVKKGKFYIDFSTTKVEELPIKR